MSRCALRAATILAAALAACLPVFGAEDWPDSVNQHVRELRGTVSTTDMDGYLAVVNNPDGALLIDVREEDEFNAGHVPGTINVPRGLLEFRIWRLLGYPGSVDLNRRIYVQCSSGGRATLAAKQLGDLGFSNVTAVVIRLEEWQAKDHPVVKNPSKQVP